MKSYTTLSNTYTDLSLNTSTGNVARGKLLINDSHRRLLEKYFFNETSTTIVTVAGQQGYDLPYNYSQLKTGTLTLGSLKWTPTEILTRREWDELNTMQLYSDIPNNYYIYGNKFYLFPTPSSSGNTITFNYKKRIPDLSFADYTTGTVTATLNSQTITGAGGTAWLANYLPASPTLLTTATTSTNSQLPTYTYDNGTAGVGATITMSNVGVLTIGGSSVALNDVVLIKDETGSNAAYNGLYKCTTEGTTSVAAILTRNTDNDQSSEFVGKGVFVTNTNITWAYTNVSAPTLGTTAITFKVANSALNLNLWIKVTAPSGDDNWYQISSIESATSLTLVNAYAGGTTSGASYTIGQMPLLLEDYQDAPIFDALVTYYTTINLDKVKAEEFRVRRAEIIAMMDIYVGKKSLNVNLSSPPMGRNPNLYQNNIG